ncbi:MAG TPA: hypothetical protein VG848_07560 [Acetobacteraceae bacterium]|nr:hypothetical protein [Acetobacteraceae bacterium]
MPRPSSPTQHAPLAPRLAQTLLASGGAAASALASALWIAICAAAPEFIWRGLLITFGHIDRPTVLAALLVGLFLAFFIEPAIERLRSLLQGAHHPGSGTGRRRSALFTAAIGLGFAFASFCLHAAMTAVLARQEGDHAPSSAALAAAIALTVAWAIVPFAVTLAWLSLSRPWLAVPLGILAAASSFLAGWLFGWTTQDIYVTAIPCVAILLLGYRAVGGEPRERAFLRCARSLGLVAVIWLLFALLADAVLALAHLDRFAIYSATSFWMDVRFYFGWALGLLFAPFPFHPKRPAAAL